MRYNLPIAYLLWLISGCGALGFHRFYMGKVGTGILWLCTGGLAGIGCIYDAITMPKQIREANIKVGVRAVMDYRDLGALSGMPGMPGIPGIPGMTNYVQPKSESAEKTILKVANKNGGFVTPGEVALEGDVTVDEARKALEKLASTGNAEMRVRSSGVVVFFFPEFAKGGGDGFAV